MKTTSLPKACTAGFCLLLAGVSLEAQDPAAVAVGSYRCMSYNVSGRGGSCANFPRLVLKADGTYQYSSTHGRWSVRDGKLHLSASDTWGPGTIGGRETLRFEYEYRGWHQVATWVCQGCARASASAPGPAPESPVLRPAAGSVGVTLNLQFTQAIGGVSGYVIVPAESARGYGHNDPLPDGAVSGLAWEASGMSVQLATNRDNRLASGRRYVVFLSWPRETIPVAVLDLPQADADYTASLEATLDGPSVLARIVKNPAGKAP